MTNFKTTRRALVSSVLALVMCFSMLLGTTFAWFTDSVTSGGNIIQTGTLEVEMHWADGTKDPASATWTDASEGAIFNSEKWEPGYVEVRHIKISNVGTLALKYQINILANGEVSDLADVIDVYYVDPAVQVSDRSQLTDENKIGTLTEVLAGMPANASGDLLAEEADTVTLAFKMRENAGNEYQGKSIGTSFSVQLLATQLSSDSDNFDDQYDVNASYDDVTMLATKDGEKAIALSFEDFCESVSAGNDYLGWTITLYEDIDFGGAEWTPIGTAVGTTLTDEGSAPFSGMLDGNGHTLSNFKVTEGVIVDGDPWLSLFTGIYAKDGNTAGVKNLNISDVTYDNPNGTIGAIVNVADSDGASALEFSNINISGTLRGFGCYGVAGLATLMYGSEVVVEDIDVDLDIIISHDFTVSSYKFISPLVGQISLKENGHITLNNIDWSDCAFYYPSTFKLEDRSTVASGYNSIWVYNTLAGIRVLGCGGYCGQFYDRNVTYTINDVDYTHAELKKDQKDYPGYMYDYIIRPDAFTPYVVATDASTLKTALSTGGVSIVNAEGVETTLADLGTANQYGGTDAVIYDGLTVKGLTLSFEGANQAFLTDGATTATGEIVFENCTFKSSSFNTSIYFQSGTNASDTKIVFNNCHFYGCVQVADNNGGGVEFNNCTFNLNDDGYGYVQCMGGTNDFNGCTFNIAASDTTYNSQMTTYGCLNTFSMNYNTVVNLNGCNEVATNQYNYKGSATINKTN